VAGKIIGTIKEVHGPVVTVSCPVLPPLHQALETRTDGDHYILEVYQHVDEESLRAIALHRAGGLKRGLPVYDSGAPIHVPVTPNCLGRLLNVFGQALDDGAPLVSEGFRNILGRPIPLYESGANRKFSSPSPGPGIHRDPEVDVFERVCGDPCVSKVLTCRERSSFPFPGCARAESR
jgi:vacuolar-type H+-ATPase subunit B/Vma2